MRRAGWLRACGLLIPLVCGFAEVRFAGEALSPNRAPLSGVRVSLESATGAIVQAFSDTQGGFTLALPARGSYLLTAERDGYYPLRSKRILIDGAQPELELTLEPVHEQAESVEVRAAPAAVDMDTTSAQQRLTSRDLVNIPYPNTSDLRSALRVVPGVVRDSRGGLHVNGASEEQALYTLNGFTINDPLTGKFDSRVSVESVQNVEVTSGNLPAEFGKGSAGALVVQTETGDDRLRYLATNFFPGFENHKGWTLSDWRPRFAFAGPLVRGRTWFSETVDLQYMTMFVRELTAGKDRTASERLSNVLHIQHNLSPSHILTGGALINAYSAARVGLSALDPIETTIDRRSRQWFFHGKHQMYIRRRILVETGFAANRTFAREIPQGHAFAQFTAYGKRGNFYMDGTRRAGRDQALLNVSLPSFALAGSHRLRFGFDLDRVIYWQDVRRTGFENFSEAGLRTNRTVFQGSGLFGKSTYEASTYLEDAWRVHRNVLLEAGGRIDWDALLRLWTPSPRLGIAWSPKQSSNTKLYGGFARVTDVSSLRLFSRPLDQYTLTTYFGPDGSIARGPALSVFTIANRHLLRPRYTNWFLGGAHRWPSGLILRADFLRRRGSRGFTYRNTARNSVVPFDEWAARTGAVLPDAIYDLTNERTDAFDSISFSVRHAFRSEYEWFAGYTRSSARSNTVVDISVEDPITITDNVGPMPWDAPHRLVSWGYFPTPFKNWAISCLLDARSGFPFSVQQDSGAVVGAVNSRKFPTFFELNLHLEHKFVLGGHRWALRAGCNDATNRINPDTVNTFVTSSRFLQFYGGNGRTFNFRIRWLGRVVK